MKVIAAVVAIAALACVRADDGGHGGDGHGDDHGEDHGNHGKPLPAYSFGLWGDMPYYSKDALVDKYVFPNHDYTQDPYTQNMVNSMNGAQLAFTIFSGDTKSGKTSCNNDLDDTMYNLYYKLTSPALYAIGDNEWTDCHRNSAKSIPSNPLDRLAYVRQKFFHGYSLGQDVPPIRLQTQADKGYPENQRFQYGAVTYALIHVPGSNNNVAAPLTPDGKVDTNCASWYDPAVALTGKPADSSRGYNCQKNSARTCADCIAATQEFLARSAADVQFLKDTFHAARQVQSKGVVISIQADMTNFDSTVGPTGTLLVPFKPVTYGSNANDGFKDFATELQHQVKTFKGQVLLTHGDSHTYVNVAGEYGPNFRRIMNPGEADMNWVKITVDESSPAVFSAVEVIANSTPHGESL